MKKIKEPKLQVGDRVWLRVPANGTITKVHPKYGYTIDVDKIEGGMEFFADKEVELILSTQLTN